MLLIYATWLYLNVSSLPRQYKSVAGVDLVLWYTA
jgi:hypothetical protein